MPDSRHRLGGPAQRAYPEYDWATLAVWAWGGMRVVDYLESREDIDMQRIGLSGVGQRGRDLRELA